MARSWSLRPKPVPRGSVAAPASRTPGNKAVLQRNQGTATPTARLDDGIIPIPDSPAREQQDDPTREQTSRPPALRANGESGEVDLEQSPDTERLLVHPEPAAGSGFRRRRRTARRSRSR
eukprot:9253243-Heterocapsa_arctica.AAC.1